jgi:predicted SnoaL-like aldol condensation-catalyzing enzyme
MHACLIAGCTDALTEAAFHIGRLKRAKQALLLVQRYKKHSEQLPKAEAALEQQLASLEQTPPQERLQLVRDLHEELRAMARGVYATISAA